MEGSLIFEKGQSLDVKVSVISSSDHWGDEVATNVLSNSGSRWNAGHLSGWDTDNWIVFDFSKRVRVYRFGLRCTGDTTHDTKDFDIQTSESPKGPWKTVSSYTANPGTTQRQTFNIPTFVGRYFRLLIKSRYTRYQAYLHQVFFHISDVLSKEYLSLSPVEVDYLLRSNRSASYQNEKIAVIETSNVADLGRLTALSFLEWVRDNPEGVVALPTGKTPELFIKYLRYYKANETADSKEALRMLELEKFPDTTNLRFVQLDEFFPISCKQHNSFLNYVRKYYITTLELKEENCLLMDFSKLPVFQEHDVEDVFPNSKVEYHNITPLQQSAIDQAQEFCLEYEARIREMGGIGFFLGGIGHDGHIAFNFRGCDPNMGTRLVTLNYETAAQSASDFGGIQFTRNKSAITIGLATIKMNPDVKIVIIAAGEKKAPMVRDAVMGSVSRKIPASAFQNMRNHNARFYLTEGSALLLQNRREEDIKRKVISGEISETEMFDCIYKLGIRVKKKLRDLTAIDFLDNSMTKYVYYYWIRKRKPLSALIKAAEESLILSLDRGQSLPAGDHILHTSPHHDDIMLAYHEICEFLIKYNKNNFVYLTSGFNAVTDGFVSNVLRRTFSSKGEKQFKEDVISDALELPLENILKLFAEGYKLKMSSKMELAETYLILRQMRKTWKLDTTEGLKEKILWMLYEYIPKKRQGEKDSPEVQIFKGAIRESECDRVWANLGVHHRNVYHTRSKFYTGDFFNPMPKEQEDAGPLFNLYKKVFGAMSDGEQGIVTVALDPEGTGPDTHYKVLQIVAQALRLLEKKDVSNIAPKLKIWGYRNVWYRFQLAHANIAIPVTVSAMNEMHMTFIDCFGCQKKAEFPSPEYDGPFSVLSQRFHLDILREYKTLLGEKYFIQNPRLRQADGIILLKELHLHEFLSYAMDLNNKIALHKHL